MVTGVSVGLDSSEDEGIFVSRRSARQKFVESDDDGAEGSGLISKADKVLDSDVEPDTKPCEDDARNDSRILMEEMLLVDVDTCKKKKKWKILLDSDCSLDGETTHTHLSLPEDEKGFEDEAVPRHSVGHNSQSHISLTKGSDLYDAEESESEVVPKHCRGHNLQSHFSLMKDSDLYDADGSEDEVAPKHCERHSPQSPSSLTKERDMYDAEGSEDEVTLKHKSKGSSRPKCRSLSQRKSKVSEARVKKASPCDSFRPQGNYLSVEF
jgi:hypothetical protein